MGRRVLIKIGGSLISPSGSEGLARLSEVIWDLSVDHSILLLAGGGDPVEFLRSLDHSIGMDDSNAHFAAIAGMEMNAYVLQSLLPEAFRIDEIVESGSALSPQLFFPLDFFRKKDPLPHSWDVTSDSIALYLADQFRCDLLVLLKSVDGIVQPNEGLVPRITLDESEVTGVVDGYFYRYPREGVRGTLECRILNGGYPDRLEELLERGNTIGTELLF